LREASARTGGRVESDVHDHAGVRGIDRDAVSRGSLPLEPREIDDLGLDDVIERGGIVAIEWAERWQGRPAGVTEVHIDHIGEDARRIRIA
jgi:hypothetical protein